MADTGDAAASPPDRRPSLSLDIAASSELAAAAAKPPSSPLPPSSSVPDTPVSTMEADESPTELATTPQEQARDERRGPLEVGGGGGGARATLAMEPAIPVSSSSSSSPSRPLFSWPSQAGSLLGVSSSDVTPSGSTSSHPGAPRRDPFDDERVNTFADDPFAQDGSDPDDPTNSADGLRRMSPDGADGEDSSPTADDSEADRTREGAIDPAHLSVYDPYARPSSAVMLNNGRDPNTGLRPPSPPPFLRAFSAPVATARLGNLVHPGRRPSQSSVRPSILSPTISSSSTSGQGSLPTRSSYQFPQVDRPSSASSMVSASDVFESTSSDSAASPPPTGLYTLSLELADSVQAAIQTLLQLTPPHLFDTAKEQFSACTVQMPATSLTSLLTAMKNLNYLSEHIAPLCADDSLLHSPSHTPGPPLAEVKARLDPVVEGLPPAANDGARPFPSPYGASRASFKGTESTTSLVTMATEPSSMLQDFDIGEMVQSVGDLLGGLTAQAGADLVLFHGDVGMKHFSVKADEGGVCYVLSHVVRQILLTAGAGDAIEIGLHVSPQSPSSRHLPLPLSIDDLSERNRTRSATADSSPTADSSVDLGPLLCTFEIIHNIAQADAPARTPMTEKGGSGGGTGFPGLTTTASHTGSEVDCEPSHPVPDLPNLTSPLTSKLVKHVAGALRIETSLTAVRRRFELALLLDRGAPLVEPANLPEEELASRQPFPQLKLGREPTLNELQVFAETLRGKKVAFHASETSVFAKHLTSYLTAWGMDMRHISTETEEEEDGDLVGEDLPSSTTGAHGSGTARGDSGYGGSSSGGSSPANGGGVLPNGSSGLNPNTSSGGHQPFEMVTSPLARANTTLGSGLGLAGLQTDMPRQGLLDRDASFIIIDDDVVVLRRRLTQLRLQASPSLSLRPRASKRPAMGSRTRSSPQIRQLLPMAPRTDPTRGVVIIHFTSLANYNAVRDAVQSMLTPGSASTLPEVMVIPKPVGPRRFLTALHTAVYRPVVDPYFTPIATSPLSPSGNFGSNFSYFPAPPPANVSPKDDGPDGGRMPSRLASTHSHSSAANGPGSRSSASSALDASGLHLAIPTPDPSNPIDFLSETASKLGQSARAGMLIQSPDGMPMGMFFDPPPRTPSSRRSSNSQRDKDASERRRTSGPHRPPIATFVTTIDSVVRSPPPVPARGVRSAGELPVGPPGSPLHMRRDPSQRHRSGNSGEFDVDRAGLPSSTSRGQLRRTTSQESKTGGASPSLDRAETSSITSTRSTRSKTGGQTVPPGVLAHRSSIGSASGSTRARSPSGGLNDEEAALARQKTHSPRESTSNSLKSPPRSSQALDEPPAEGDAPPVPPTPVKKSSKKSGGAKKKAAKDDGMVVPPINVLIVEDNPINQTILSTFMKKKKIKFGVANNGLEAVEMWKTGGFHLILMDIQLPVMDGMEATREIRKLEKHHNIGVFPSTPTSEIVRTPSPSAEMPTSPFRSSVIIVALTASSLSSDRVSALAAGCNDFLTKPVSLKWLEKKIVEWGSMQALIDFDGWRRWRGADPAASALEKGFGAGPDAQARALRNRLKIDRGPNRMSPKNTAALPLLPGAAAAPSAVVAAAVAPDAGPHIGPDINIQQPTPHDLPESSNASAPASGAVSPDVPVESLTVEELPMADPETLPDRPASPVNDEVVPAATLANVPVSGSDALAQHLQRAAEEQRQEVLRDKMGFPLVLGGGRGRASSSSHSIASLQFVTTPVGENPAFTFPTTVEDEESTTAVPSPGQEVASPDALPSSGTEGEETDKEPEGAPARGDSASSAITIKGKGDDGLLVPPKHRAGSQHDEHEITPVGLPTTTKEQGAKED